MNTKINIIADCDIPYLQGVLEPYANISYLKGKLICADDLAHAQVLITRTRTVCNESLLSASPVKLILTATIGFDHIDLKYCKQAGIEVRSAAGCNARAVVQWVAAVLALDSKKMGWQPQKLTLGVIGVGNVGSLVARYAKTWGFKVLCCDPYKNNLDYVTHEDIFTRCDIITMHVPCTNSGDYPTYHLLNKEACTKLKTNALILNASRGEIIDTKGLNKSNKALRLAIDTWEGEPELDTNLLANSIVATPHVAGYSAQGKANGTSMVVRQLAEIFNFPLKDWYPSTVKQITPYDISWSELCMRIDTYYPIASESESLKKSPENFELMRNDYQLREEFF